MLGLRSYRLDMMRIYGMAGILTLLTAFVAVPAQAAFVAQPVAKPAPSAPVKHAAATHAHRGGKHRRYQRTAGFVPPPPAFMPSILPEMAARRMQGFDGASADVEVIKPENPYVKYIHTPEGVAPTPLQTRKGVVTWTHRS